MAIIDFLLSRLKFLKAYYKPVYTVMLTVFLFVSALAFGVYNYNKSEKYERLLSAQYMRAVSDVSLMVDNIETNLIKGIVATNPKEFSKIANRIYTDAAVARITLGQIPSQSDSLSGVSKFLTQLGDYTYNIALKSVDGGEISVKEYDAMENFVKESENLSASLGKINEEIYGNRTNLLDIEKYTSEKFKEQNSVFSSLTEENGQHFASLPSLIYDGPYSDHIKNKKSAMLEGKENISKEAAEKVVKKLFGNKFKGAITFSGETEGNMPVYSFIADAGNGREVAVDVTRQGGAISLILDNRYVPQSKIPPEDAVNNAYSFLSRYDFGKMQNTYYEISDNVIIINFAAVQNDVVCYPDLVKIKVALDNGEILGIECSGFISNHKKRDLPAFNFSENEIKQELSPKVTPEKITKCIIPTDFGSEIFCYEVKCRYKDKTFLIYLNAETLKEEDILILTETDTSSLTM